MLRMNIELHHNNIDKLVGVEYFNFSFSTDIGP